MNAVLRRRLERAARVRDFIRAHKTDGTGEGTALARLEELLQRAEALAAHASEPKALPCQMLDYASGYLMAFGALAALLRQRDEGGSWHVRVSLAQTGRWLRSLGRIADGFSAPRADLAPYLEASDSGFGKLVATRHPVKFSVTPARWTRPSMPPGSHPPVWP